MNYLSYFITFWNFIKKFFRNPLEIYVYAESKDAVIPKVAYNNTSAAFDISATEDVTINPNEAKEVPNGLRIIIKDVKPYYMTIHLRSSLGFKKKAIPHCGIVDSGYTGDLGVLVHNFGSEPIEIKKGDRYAQILVHKKPKYELIEIDYDTFKKIESEQQRGSKGFGSSGKN